MAPRMAFVGMGQMGQAIAKNIVDKAELDGPMLLWNRTAAKATAAAEHIGKGARAVSDLAEVASGADIIWSCLLDDKAVEDVFGQLLAADAKGKIFVDCSSIPVSTTDSLSERIQKAGGEFVAMPVFGDPGMAQKALLIVILSGPKAAVEKVKPYLQGVIAHSIVDMSGEEPGNALKIKLIGNTLILAAINSVAEALTFADKTGVGAEHMAALIKALWPRPPQALYVDRMMSGDYHSGTAQASVAMARGLAGKVLAMAEQSGTSVPGYRVAVDRLAEAEEAHNNQADITAVYGAVRKSSGLPFKNN